MINPYIHKNTKSVNSKTELTFEFIKSLFLVGLESGGSYALENSYTEGILSTPTVRIIDGSPKIVYFDYNTSNTSTYDATTAGKLATAVDLSTIVDIKSKVYSFFENFKSGDTFDVSNSVYNFNQYDINGTYVFKSFYNNVLVSTSTGLSFSPEQLYLAVSFDDVPVITSNTTKNISAEDNQCYLTNKMPAVTNSFSASGIIQNSVIEIGDIKYRVESTTRKSNSEVLLLSSTETTITIPPVSLLDKTLINVYNKK